MKNTVIPMTRADVGLQYATVNGRAEQWYFLSAPASERALRADSCLIEPDCGDTVLVCAGGKGAAAYIIAVLARADRSNAVLTLPGNGKLTLSAEQLELNGRDSVSIQAPKVVLAAVAGEMTFGKLVQKVKNSFRWTENLDETRAGRIRLQVDGHYRLKAKHASMIADGQVKIDAEKIDLG